MSTFNIDFFELAFLAEACIPPKPIARAGFWQDLTRKYWAQMTEDERARLFEWMQKNPRYEQSLQEQEDTRVFHARFDPDNQYMVTTEFENEKKTVRAYKLGDRYYVEGGYYVSPDCITSVNSIKPKILN